MNYKIKHTGQVVFLFVAIPVVLLLMAIVFVAIRQNMFEKRFHYYTALQDAIGVSTQTPILYKGFEIGRISDFNLTDKGEIQIRFYVLKRYNRIMKQNSVISRTNNPITGRTLLEFIENPDTQEILVDGASILSTDFPEGKALFRKISPRSVDTISAIIDNVYSLSSELNRDNNADRGAIFRILTTVADITEQTKLQMQQIEAILGEVNSFAQNMNRDNNAGQGTTFRILSNVADITQKVDRQMLQVDSLLSSVNRTARTFENPDSLIVRMIDPSGENLILPVRGMINAFTANLDQTHALLSILNRNNPELLLLINNLNDTLANAKKTLEALNNNPILRSGISPSRTGSNPTPSRIAEVPDEN